MTKERKKFNLRFANYYDVNAIVDLLHPNYFEESQYKGLTFDLENCQKTVAEWITEYCAIAEMDGKVVGVVAFYFLNSYYKEKEGDIIIFYVHPDYRGTGVARALVGIVEKISKELDAAVVYTTSGSGMGRKNDKLYSNLFKKFGFEELGTELIWKNERVWNR